MSLFHVSRFYLKGFKDESGNITGAVEVARDVTEQKKAEVLLNKTLLEQTEDLKRLNNEISDAAGYVKAVLPKAIISGTLLTDWRFIPSASLGGDSFGYQSKIQEISRPSRLYVFSDGVYDITKKDGSIWGLNDFMEFSAQSFSIKQSNLDFLLSYAQELAQEKEFEDDFTILEIAFE
jgi:serine phosphatase RsbU (regulator of sigma subunit)